MTDAMAMHGRTARSAPRRTRIFMHIHRTKEISGGGGREKKRGLSFYDETFVTDIT